MQNGIGVMNQQLSKTCKAANSIDLMNKNCHRPFRAQGRTGKMNQPLSQTYTAAM
jgi:hypothetical protein